MINALLNRRDEEFRSFVAFEKLTRFQHKGLPICLRVGDGGSYIREYTYIYLQRA
jgi:hypothetical protein